MKKSRDKSSKERVIRDGLGRERKLGARPLAPYVSPPRKFKDLVEESSRDPVREANEQMRPLNERFPPEENEDDGTE